MNTFRFPSSVSSTRAPFTRAQLSPLSRGNSAQSTAANATTSRFPFRIAQAPAFPLWSTAILDRLQPVLTRYHE